MGRRKSRSRHKLKKGKEMATSSAAPPPWIELPRDITANILQRLGAEEILERAQNVCTTWRKVCQDPAMWRVIDLDNLELFYEEYDKMCGNAVDRSQGQLVDLSITAFGDEELMNYIADRSSNLKRLQLINCYGICEGLAEAARKLPLLEELHLIMMKNVPAEAIEAIGNSCPKLKSFTYNFHGPPQDCLLNLEDDPISGYNCNDYARAIANSMPNLLHLRLCADMLNNEGLEAILDGCPCLESLDLRQCVKLDLSGDLGRRCSRQIKVLKLPSDSVSDVWWLNNNDEVEDEMFYDSETSAYSFDYIDGYYGHFEKYEDYTSPFGFGYFGQDAFFDDDDI